MKLQGSALFSLIVVIGTFGLPATGRGQIIPVVAQPRTFLSTSADSARAAGGVAEFRNASTETRNAAIAAPRLSRKATFPLNGSAAADVWGNQVHVLPSATLAPGSKDAALFTELAAQLSGGWRFVVGTTLSVETKQTNGSDDGAAAEETAEEAANREFRKFVAGGGNVSFAAMRPIGRWNQELGTHLLFLVPRGWANIPELGSAEDVRNFGGELIAEYQYQRYGNRPAEAVTGDDSPQLPFLTFHVDAGIAHGTRSFFRGIGRTNRSAFLFVAPTITFLVRDQLKLGATYFFGPNDFKSHQSLSIALTVVPKQPSGTNSQNAR